MRDVTGRGVRGRAALAVLVAALLLTAGLGGTASAQTDGRAAVAAAPAGMRPRDLSGLVVPDGSYAIPTDALYVDVQHGSDTNKGTLALPFATVARAIAAAKVGGTIVLRSGTYREGLGIVRKRLTIESYPHEQVWLSGSVVVSDWSQDLADRPDGGVWVHGGWTTQFCQTCFDPKAVDKAYPTAGLPDMVFVNGKPLTQVRSIDQVGPGSFYVDYAQQALYVGDDPTVAGTTVEATTQSLALQFGINASGSALLGIGVEQYAADWNFSPIPAMVLTNGATNVTFDRDVFAYSASRGLTLYGAGSHVTNSWFVLNGYTGLHGNKADGVDVENNFVAGNNAEHFFDGFSPAAAASGIKFTTTANAIIRGNIAQDNYGNGIWFDVSSYNPTIVDNLAQRNDRNGIYVEITGYGIVASNLAIYNGQAGIKLSGATFVRVYNNTSADNLSYQLSVHDDGRRNTNPAQIAQGITWNPASNQLINNILVAPMAGEIGPMIFTQNTSNPKVAEASTMITAMDGNVYGRSAANKPQGLAVWTHPTPIPLSHYNKLAQMQAGTGYDMHALEYIGYSTSPIFNNEPIGDYSLRAGSAARASGQPLPADIAAAIGVAATDTPDRGALIYPLIVSAPPTP